jgi:hypothetical protein
VVAFFIGVPQADHGNIVKWASDVFGNDGTPEGMARWQDAIMAYGANLVSTRRARPSKDVMSILLSTEVDGQPLTDSVLLHWFLALNQAGVRDDPHAHRPGHGAARADARPARPPGGRTGRGRDG